MWAGAYLQSGHVRGRLVWEHAQALPLTQTIPSSLGAKLERLGNRCLRRPREPQIEIPQYLHMEVDCFGSKKHDVTILEKKSLVVCRQDVKSQFIKN